MRPQIELLVVVTSSLQNIAPTNGFNNIFNFDNSRQIIYFCIIFNFSLKLPARMLLFRPRIHKNPQQQKFNNRSNLHSRSRGVAKVGFGLPMLHGKHFFLCFPCSVGTSKTLFATPPQREGLFFHFSENFPARSSKIMRMQFSNHCSGIT